MVDPNYLIVTNLDIEYTPTGSLTASLPLKSDQKTQ